MTTCRKCTKTWTGKRLEHCTVCHETFSGTSAGDKHRTGDYAAKTRRCLNADEMRAKGMAQNERGVWMSGGTMPRFWETTPGAHNESHDKPAEESS